MPLELRILAVRQQIDAIAGRLPTLGYRFTEPHNAFPGPEAGTEAAIEREVGALPDVIKLFWRLIGSVNLIGAHADWSGCEYPDPLVVYPPSVAISELDKFLADREERTRCNLPYAVPIAPDAYHKENVSGGMWYNLTIPAVAEDPLLNDERHQTTFTSYLELAVRWGGFPGLEQSEHHDWPLRQILGGSVTNG
jgi:hypothetical protein